MRLGAGWHSLIRLLGMIAVAAMLGTPTAALANLKPHHSLEKLAHLSDVVVIGHVEALAPGTGDRSGWMYAVVRVAHTLKGRCDATIEVVSYGGDPEGDAGPMPVGKRYLLFLVRVPGGEYAAVNGPGSVFGLDEAF